MRGLVSIIFLIHLVIIQGDNSDKTRKHNEMSIKNWKLKKHYNANASAIEPQIRLKIDDNNIFLSAQWIVIAAKMIVACSLERRWIAEGTRHKTKRQNS